MTVPPLRALRLYQQELVGIAYEQRSPRLANIADAIGHELCALASTPPAEGSAPDVPGSEANTAQGNPATDEQSLLSALASAEERERLAEAALREIDLRELPLRYAEEDDTDYFLRAIKYLKEIARQARSALSPKSEGRGEGSSCTESGTGSVPLPAREAERAGDGALSAEGRLTHADACRLSRLFNERSDLRTDQDQRINGFLKALIVRRGFGP